MLPLELWKLDGEPREGHADSDGLQCDRKLIFSPTLHSKKKSDLVDFVKLNNHGNLVPQLSP
jgi:hypothetical protein